MLPDQSSAAVESGEQFSLRILRGGAWAFSLRVLHQFFYFARLILLARLLSPRDFGLLGIALLTISILNMFSQTGFHSALIQKKENVEAYLDTAWTVLVVRGFGLFLIVYFLSPLISLFFQSPEAEPVLRFIGLSLVIQAWTNIGVIFFQKDLDFKKQFLYQSLGLLVDFVVAATAAILLRSVWALVLGRLAGDLTRCGMSFFIHPYRPRFALDRRKSRELFGFGKWVLGSSVLVFLITQGDDIFVGKILGAAMLGLYQLAYKLSNTPATEITNVISEVMFPAYSKIQDDAARLKETFFKVLRTTTFFSFPVAGLILVFAPAFTRIALGEKWMGMVPAVQVLCLFGVLSSVNSTFGAVFYAKGRPQILTKIEIIQLIFLGAVIYPATALGGILGTSVAVTLTCGIDLVLCLIEIRKLLGYRGAEILAQILSQALMTAAMSGAAFGFQRIAAPHLPPVPTFALSLALALAMYAAYGRKILLSFWKMKRRLWGA